MIASIRDINLRTVSWGELADTLLHEAFHFGIQLIICIAIYIIGRKIIHCINLGIGKIMSSKEFDPSVVSFLKSLINIILTVVLLIMIVNILGVNNSSFVALLASVGVALGMALSGTLQNVAGGVMILLFRPYKVGDFIEAQGQGGTVKEIQIFNTIIVTSDNKTIFIPNGGLSSNVIVNYNNQKTRRIEWVITLDYETDYEQAKKIIQDVLATDTRILANPEPNIVIKMLSGHTFDVQVRAWVKRTVYWDVYYAMNELIYKNFKTQGIDASIPKMTVVLQNQEAE
jgi:small conductance mechanosensitive channel